MAKQYLTAKEVASRLGVSLPTVYAYVSRGLLHSESVTLAHREHRYLAEDVQRLLEKRELRSDPTIAARTALRWGSPIMESAITSIGEDGFCYRGLDVVNLAMMHTFEEVLALLWSGSFTALLPVFSATSTKVATEMTSLSTIMPPLISGQIMLLLAAQDDVGSLDPAPSTARLQETGIRILHTLLTAITGQISDGAPVSEQLQRCWRPDLPDTRMLFDQALILCADHELNASSFTARIVASAHAHLYHVVNAALSALQGLRHGGFTVLVEDLLDEIAQTGNCLTVLERRLRQGRNIPGFDHHLYPEGDPRGKLLIHAIGTYLPDHPVVHTGQDLCRHMERLTGKKPTIDVGLVMTARALGLVNGTALSLFALGRTAGWIAHALEQVQSGELIRPRAIYVGPKMSLKPSEASLQD